MQRLDDSAAAREKDNFAYRHARNPRPLCRIVVRNSAEPSSHGQDNMASIVLIRRIWCKCGDVPPAIRFEAGFFKKLTTSSTHRVAVPWFHAAGRDLKRFYAQAVPVLLNKNDVAIFIYGDNLYPICIFENIKRGDRDAFPSPTGISSYADPSILYDVD